MMKQNLRSNREDFRRKFIVLCILQEYYSGNLWDQQDNWKDNLSKLTETKYQDEIDLFREGLKLVANPDKKAMFDYNRLFVGPGKLLAPPYESSYRNPKSLVMQKETLDVRAFYSTVGLISLNQNSQPDDFLALELEFMGFLLFNAMMYFYDDNDRSEHFINLYTRFLEEHLGKWIYQHCEEILAQSTSDFCRGMALITKGFIEHELMLKEEIAV